MTHAASCLCGAIKVVVTGQLPGPVACHCSQCRKQSGHFWASVDLPKERVTIAGPVSWFQASEKAQRGFCGTCGSFLLWEPIGEDTIAVAMGAFDGATGVEMVRHIYVADKGDYYRLADGLPQEPQ